MALTTFTAGGLAKATEVNANFALCVLTDTSRTVAVTHTYTAAQTFTGGWTAAAACSLDHTADSDALAVSVTHASYANDAIQISATRAASSAFFFLRTLANSEQQIFLRGDGFGGFVGLTVSGTVAAGTYQVNISGAAGAARDIFQAGQSGHSNGFTVQYDGSKMVYTFAGTSSTVSMQALTATSITPSLDVTLANGKYLKGTRSTGGLVHNLIGVESGSDRVLLTATGDWVIQDGSSNANFTLTTAGAGTLRAGITATTAKFTGLGAFAAGDKYVIADASGNLHLSALGPAS